MGSLCSTILASDDEFIFKVGAISIDNSIYKRVGLLSRTG